ncbi:unnamed protein product [Acanthoscelides obtectus]|uniref:Uncharacterized protein n=1 Tax=Acanthoscelides obtectus TaxID=200917 RepID=A0A9P0MCD1_ACAOB|nr:unnamed protein product [Acanthoscelides obtectus]CAK1629875.1 hypothetical protein AOBTE_LOCUS6011 [Acanthoscelides obtectus]
MMYFLLQSHHKHPLVRGKKLPVQRTSSKD